MDPATRHFLFALAALAARGVALGMALPSRALLVCIGSGVRGAALPLWSYVPGVESVEFAVPPEGLAIAPDDFSLDEPFEAAPRLLAVPLPAEDA